MVSTKDNAMGRLSVEVELANNDDVRDAKRGRIPQSDIRNVKIPGVVDSGAARLVIPESVARQLGLKTSATTQVRYADGRTAQRQIVGEIHLRYGDRGGVFNAIVEPARESALIGAIVMEDLDLIVDGTAQKLVPRDPRQIISEVE